MDKDKDSSFDNSLNEYLSRDASACAISSELYLSVSSKEPPCTFLNTY